MSIATQITRLQAIREQLRDALIEKGVSAQNYKMSEFAPVVRGFKIESDWQSNWATSGGGGNYPMGGTSTKWIIYTAQPSSLSGCTLVATIPYTHSREGEQKLYIYKVTSPSSTYSVSMTYGSAYSYTWTDKSDLSILLNFTN